MPRLRRAVAASYELARPLPLRLLPVDLPLDGEGWRNFDEVRMGIDFLRKRARTLRFGSANLNIAGVDYQRIANRATYLNGAERMIVPGAVNIMLSHNPDVFPAWVEARKRVLAGIH